MVTDRPKSFNELAASTNEAVVLMLAGIFTKSIAKARALTVAKPNSAVADLPAASFVMSVKRNQIYKHAKKRPKMPPRPF